MSRSNGSQNEKKPSGEAWLFRRDVVVGCYQRANELGIAIPGPD
jgi:hypothetical protein